MIWINVIILEVILLSLYCYYFRWDEWRGSIDGKTKVLFIKRLICIPLWRNKMGRMNFRVDLHKMAAADEPECYHSHPSWALRWILWGGYVEEIYAQDRAIPRFYFDFWKPWDFGFVAPDFIHRIDRLLNGKSSYSLWFRGPVIQDVRLLGEGWPKNEVEVTHGERN